MGEKRGRRKKGKRIVARRGIHTSQARKDGVGGWLWDFWEVGLEGEGARRLPYGYPPLSALHEMEGGDDAGWENMISLVVAVVLLVVWGAVVGLPLFGLPDLFLFACNAMHSDGCGRAKGGGRGVRDEKYHFIVQYTSLAELNVAVVVVVVCLLVRIPH